MKSRQRRLKAIELTLTPRQVVLVWLRNAMAAGTMEENARHWPPHRGAVANAVYSTVRNSMKGQDDSLIERAVLQARQEADSLYQLVVNANMAVFEDRSQREREYILLLGYLGAECRATPTKDWIENLRLAFLMFIEPVIVLDAAIAQLVAERLNGQPVLFGDIAAKLAEQLQMATDLSTWFNMLALEVGSAEINLEERRNSLQSEADRQVSIWVSRARVTMLSLFGEVEEMHAAMAQGLLLCKSESDEASKSLVH